MSLLKSVTTIAGSSIISQVIGAGTIWMISNYHGMAEVGKYALMYSFILIGAQVCTYASQLLLPKQKESNLGQNIAFCIVQPMVIAAPYSLVIHIIYQQSFFLVYMLTVCYSLILVSENLLLREEKFRDLALQRLSVSILIFLSIWFSDDISIFYLLWSFGLSIIIILWINYSIKNISFNYSMFTFKNNLIFYKKNKIHFWGVGSAEVLAMTNSNLPMILIGFWFSPVIAGYFAVVSRFCLSPIIIIGNAVRNSIFSKWSIDFRNKTFNYNEFVKVKRLLLALGLVATFGICVFYPILVEYVFGQEFIDSIPTSRYMLPYLFSALAICPLTVLELVYGSPKYFLRIQLEQLIVVFLSFIIFPLIIKDYNYSILLYACLSFVRYAFIYLKVNNRAKILKKEI